MASPKEVLEIAGHEVAISNPDKVFFPRTGHTKIDLVQLREVPNNDAENV